MVHYNFLKLTDGTEVDEVFCRCQDVYARLEEELDFLHSARVCRCATVRDSNADIMMVMELDAPDRLQDYLQHPMHVALAQGMKERIAARMSFDEE